MLTLCVKHWPSDVPHYFLALGLGQVTDVANSSTLVANVQQDIHYVVIIIIKETYNNYYNYILYVIYNTLNI